MIHSKIRKLLIEQISTNSEETINRIKKYIQYWNQLSFEDQKQIGEDPNGVGKDFFLKSEELLNSLKNSGEASKEYIDNNKQDIAKTIFDFKAILSQYPEVYEVAYKDVLDQIANDIDYKTEETPTSSTPKSSEVASAPSETETSPQTSAPTPNVEYSGTSIVDYLNQAGKPSDFASRKALAQKMGIPNYTGTASQNLLMLNALKSGQTGIPVKSAETLKPEDKSMDSVPSIKFGDMQFLPYVDMGGGRYVKATPEQISNPNIQLYIQNPKKGAGEYNKANFVKVRREKGGQEIRRQSQFGGLAGSASNILGDIGSTLSKPFRK